MLLPRAFWPEAATKVHAGRGGVHDDIQNENMRIKTPAIQNYLCERYAHPESRQHAYV